MYDTAHDAERYLAGSIIRYGLSPILVEGIAVDGDGNIILKASYLRSGAKKRIKITDDKLNFNPVPLGYGVDSNGRLYFISRLPIRRWKQGLHPENYTYHPNSLGRLHWRNKEDLKALANTIQGKFRSFKEALENGGVFHRLFCIKVKGGVKTLGYRGDSVGVFVNGEVQLFDEYRYLDNYVREVCHEGN